jgi:NAD(P)-dependent dehydrogenase (short-subunit alcohol dehydrogenase family)
MTAAAGNRFSLAGSAALVTGGGSGIGRGAHARRRGAGARAHPRRSPGRALDIGGAAVILASRASDYLHGVVLPLDGGYLVR